MNNKIAGLYVKLTNVLNALAAAGEDVALEGVDYIGSASGGVAWDPERETWSVEQA